MKEHNKLSLITISLIVFALVISYLSIASYINTVNNGIEKTDTTIKNNYDIYNSAETANFNNVIHDTVGLVKSISRHEEELTQSNGSTHITSFDEHHFNGVDKGLIPTYADFVTKEQLDEFAKSFTPDSTPYLLCDKFANNPTVPTLIYNEAGSREFIFLNPCIDTSKYTAVVAHYDADTYAKKLLSCPIIEQGEYSLFSTNFYTLYRYEPKEDSLTLFPNYHSDELYELSDNSADENEIITADIEQGKSGTLDVRNQNDTKEFRLYYSPLTLAECQTADLYSFILVPNSSGLTSSMISEADNKALQLSVLLLSLYLTIAIAVFFLHNYYNKRQDKSDREVEIETRRFYSIISYSRWLIWEYNFSTSEFSFITERNNPPMLIAQYKNYILHNNLILSDDIKIFDSLMEHLQNGDKEFHEQFRILYNTSDYHWYSFDGYTIFDDAGNPVTAQIIASDIDEHQKELERAKNSSEHDPLTRVYNLNAIREHTSVFFGNDNTSMKHAFVLVDFDNFRLVNDNYGQAFGDAILIDFTGRLSSITGNNDLIGHVSADKFILCLYNIPNLDYVKEISEKILSFNMFNNFLLEEDNELFLTCSIGIAICPDNADNFEDMMNAIDIALCHAKNNGRNRYVIYDTSLADIRTGKSLLSLTGRTATGAQKTSVDNDLVFNVVDILSESKELNASLPMALSLIGNYYALDQIGIVEYSNNSMTAVMTHSWHSNYFERFSKEITTLDQKVDESIAKFRDNEDEVFCTNNIDYSTIADGRLSDVLKCAAIQSIYQCAISDNRQNKGYIFAISKDVVDWHGHIKDTMTLLSKIIGGYINKYRYQENVMKLVQTDMLTGSDNLMTFSAKASSLISLEKSSRFAMIYLDINKFKLVNDKYGYSIGDNVLITLSDIIKKFIDEKELFAHVDADKFVILTYFKGMSDFDSRIMTLFKNFTDVIKNDIGYRISLIAGVCLIQDDIDISAAIDRANIARKSIKEHHNTTYEIFSDSMKSELILKNDIENSMEAALDNGEFKVYYQPKTNIFTNKICGSEALVRWNRPDSGIVSPGVFIPIFEENGFVVNVDYFVFEKVCKTLRTLMDKGVKVYPVSVNFSRVHLKSNDILLKLKETTDRYKIDPSYIEVEITESALSEGDDFTPALLSEIKKMGFKLSMDDFGCGLSSLNSLRKFPFDILKLDKEFFNKDGIGEKEQIVVTNVVNLAKQLNMSIIAEGIETAEQLDFLRSINCSVVQGYVYSPPIPEERFIKEYLEQ